MYFCILQETKNYEHNKSYFNQMVGQHETIANLTDEHPKFYDKVVIEYHFHGENLNEKKLQRAVDLSIEKYCGVMEMFRQFAELDIKTIFHKK